MESVWFRFHMLEHRAQALCEPFPVDLGQQPNVAIILARRRGEAVKRELKTCHVDELLTRKDTDLPCGFLLVPIPSR